MEELGSVPRGTNLQKIDTTPLMLPEEYQQLDEGRHLLDYLHVILRRKWIIITFFFVVVTTVLVGTYLITPIYRATVMLKVEGENPYVMLFKDQNMVLQQNSGQEYIETQMKILKSRKLARKVVRALGLEKEKNASTLLPARGTAMAADEGERGQVDTINPKLVDSMLNQINVAPMPRTSLVSVSVDSASPDFAAKAVNEVARSFINLNIESKYEASQQARDWLEKQLVDVRAKVERSEEALNKFATQHKIIRPPSSDSKGGESSAKTAQYDRLDELNAELTKATTERINREMILRESRAGDDSLSSVVATNPSVEAIKKELVTKEAEYAKLSVVFKPDYPKMIKLKEEVHALRKQISMEAGRTLGSIRKDYQVAMARENYLKNQIEQYKQETLAMNDKLVQYQILKRDADTNKELYNGILQRLKEAGISASITTSNIVILDRAEVPKKPFKPNKGKNMLFALFVGIFGGVALAFFIEYLDNTVKSPDDVEKTVNLPSLGIVPHVPTLADSEIKPMIGGPSVAYAKDRKSSLVEAYRAISTYIQFSSPVRPPKVVLITSARSGEGKTTTSINIARTMANSSGHGIIIDCDLRKPQLHKVFSVDNSVGLTSYLTGHVEYGHEGLIQATEIPNLSVITSGIIPPNPSELLSSYRMKDILTQLFNQYSFVVLDTPPILGLSDALILSTITDGVIIVVRAGSTPKDSVIQARKLLRGVNARILGIVLNGIRESDLRYSSYSYYYTYYYSEDESPEKGKTKRRKRKDRGIGKLSNLG